MYYGGKFKTKAKAISEFRKELISAYPEGATLDYWTAQLMWSEFTDTLCKAGVISQRQWNNWTTPFPYGKPLKIRKTYTINMEE